MQYPFLHALLQHIPPSVNTGVDGELAIHLNISPWIHFWAFMFFMLGLARIFVTAHHYEWQHHTRRHR